MSLKSKLNTFGYMKRHHVVHVKGGSYVAMAATTDIASGNAVVDGVMLDVAAVRVGKHLFQWRCRSAELIEGQSAGPAKPRLQSA
jgi:hypothetical protein